MAEVEKRDDQSHPGENYRMLGIVYPAKLVREIREGRDEESNRNLAGNTFTVTVEEDEDEDDDDGEEEEGKKKKKKKKAWRTETLTLDDYLTLCVKYFIPLAEEVIARDEIEEKLTLSSGESVPSSSDEMEV